MVQKTLLQVATPNMAQVRSICVYVAQFIEIHRRDHIQTELSQRDGDIELLRADLGALGKSVRQFAATLAAKDFRTGARTSGDGRS